MAIFTEPLFSSWRPRGTCITPKKGMLVQGKDDYERIYNKDETKQWVLIVSSFVDEYGNCKFEYLSGTKTEWTEWMTLKSFNEEYTIKNPWI